MGDTQITDSYTVTGDTTITANFTRTTRTYTVTILRNDTSYGTVSQSSVTGVPYGATIKRGSSSNQLIVNTTTVTATPTSSSSSASYSFSGWRLNSSSGTAITTTGTTISGNTTVYAVFTSSTFGATIASFYGPSTITYCAEGTQGTVGGTVSFSYYAYAHRIIEAEEGYYWLMSGYSGYATIKATAKSGYTFAGWYSSNRSTTPLSTNTTYSIAVTTTTSSGTINGYFGLFKATASTIISNMFNPYNISSIKHEGENNFSQAKITALQNTKTVGLNSLEPFILGCENQLVVKRNSKAD